ncbi:MAG: SigE family RNA polymerase sigma factor [Mycobacteriales bacterium]
MPTAASDGAPDQLRRRPDLWELYADHRLHLVRLAYLLVGDASSAEDVVQEAFARVQPKWRGLDDGDAALAYLRSSVLNCGRSLLRRRAVAARLHFAPPQSQPSAEVLAILADDSRALVVALGRLTQRHREVLVLRYWGGLSEREIAASLGIAPGSVKSSASRGLAALERLLEDRR